jgi:hypothetical protein
MISISTKKINFITISLKIENIFGYITMSYERVTTELINIEEMKQLHDTNSIIRPEITEYITFAQLNIYKKNAITEFNISPDNIENHKFLNEIERVALIKNNTPKVTYVCFGEYKHLIDAYNIDKYNDRKSLDYDTYNKRQNDFYKNILFPKVKYYIEHEREIVEQKTIMKNKERLARINETQRLAKLKKALKRILHLDIIKLIQEYKTRLLGNFPLIMKCKDECNNVANYTDSCGCFSYCYKHKNSTVFYKCGHSFTGTLQEINHTDFGKTDDEMHKIMIMRTFLLSDVQKDAKLYPIFRKRPNIYEPHLAKLIMEFI